VNPPPPPVQPSVPVVELNNEQIVNGQRGVVKDGAYGELDDESLSAARLLVAERPELIAPLGDEEVVKDPSDGDGGIDYRHSENYLLLELADVGFVAEDLTYN